MKQEMMGWQQMQQKDAHFGGELGHSDAASSYGVSPSSSGSGLMSAPMHGMLFQQPPGTYVPMMPPMMMGGSMMGGNPGSSPVTARKSSAQAANEDVSLRPVRNFAPLLKPNTPAMLPYSAQSSSTTRTQGSNLPTPAGLLVQKQITVIQVPTLDKSKDKAHRAAVEMSRDELMHAVESVMCSLLETGSVDDAAKTLHDIKPPKRHIPELLNSVMLQTFDRSDEDRENVSQLVSLLKSNGTITSDNFMEAFISVLEDLSKLEQDYPLAKSHMAQFAAGAVSNGIITIAELASPLTSGFLYPLFLLCLQQLAKLKDREWLVKAFRDSKVNLQNMLPELDNSKDRMTEILEDRGLSFLFPLLRVQSEMSKQLQADPNPTSFFKWIRDNVDGSLYGDPGFITTLVTTIVQHVTSETTMKDGVDVSVQPDKSLTEMEKELLGKFQGVLKKFLMDKIPLHITAIYALQVFAYNNGSPKGLLLRMFMNLYNFEVIDEDAFMQWKEELNDVHPGKGQALFQVNQWLMWLEQAEEESDEDD